MDNEKLKGAKPNDEDLEKVAGGYGFEIGTILNQLKLYHSDIKAALEADYNDDLNVRNFTKEEALAARDKRLKGIICSLCDLNPERTVFNEDAKTPNVYVTNSGQKLTLFQVMDLLR